MGAIVFIDFWLFPKLNLHNFFAERHNQKFNWAAGLTWFCTLGICLLLVQFAGIQIYFVSLPGWFIASGLYIGLSKIYQNKIRPRIA